MKRIIICTGVLGIGASLALVGCKTAPKEPQASLDILLDAEFTPVHEPAKPPRVKETPKPPPKIVEKKAPAKAAIPAKPTVIPAKPTPTPKAAKPAAKPAPKRVAKVTSKPPAKPTKEPAKPEAKPKPPAVPKLTLPDQPEDPTWQDPMLMNPAAWNAQNWANPGTVTRQKAEVILAASGGEKDKSAFAVQVTGSLESRGKILLNLRNPQKANLDVTFAFITGAKPDNYFETPATPLKPGMNKDVTVNLRAETFKCKGTEWKHTSEPKGLDKVSQFIVLLYTKQKDKVGVSNVRFVK